MATIPEEHMDLLDGPVMVSLATVMPDGQPQVHPVWADFDGQHVRINSVAGRPKHRNMQERPKVTVLMIDPENPFRWIEVRGTVVKIDTEGADAHIDKLANDYLGVDVYPGHSPDMERFIAYIEPTRVITAG